MKLTPWPYPLWIAHRGAGKLAPENTLAAFRLGSRYGYRAFECDVKLSCDNVPFLLHDATLDRTTSAAGDAAAQAWSALSQLDAGGWHSRAYAGEPLASFAAIAAYCLRNRYALDIEIKPSPGRERETGERVAREAARLWNGQAILPLLSSFKPDSLEGALRLLRPDGEGNQQPTTPDPERVEVYSRLRARIPALLADYHELADLFAVKTSRRHA